LVGHGDPSSRVLGFNSPKRFFAGLFGAEESRSFPEAFLLPNLLRDLFPLKAAPVDGIHHDVFEENRGEGVTDAAWRLAKSLPATLTAVFIS